MRHLARTFFGGALLAVLALLAPAAASAQERFGAARTVDRASGGERIGMSAVGIDERGRFLAAWTRGDRRRVRLVAARGTPRRGFDRAAVLRRSRRTIDSPVIEFDGRQRAMIAWRRLARRAFRLESRTVSPRGAVGPVQILTGSGPSSAFLPQFVDPVYDRPVLWWLRGTATDPDVQLARARVDGRFSRTVRYDIEDATGEIDMGAAPDGTLYAAIIRRDPATRRLRVFVARQAPGATEATLTAVSDGLRLPREPQVVSSRARGVVVAWTESEGTSERVVSVQSLDGETYTAPEAIADGGFMSNLKVVATTEDVVLAGWVATPRGPAYTDRPGRLRLTTIGAPGAPTPIVTTQTTVAGFALDADGRGGATAAYIDAANRRGGRVYAAGIGDDGVVGAPQQLSRVGERARTATLAAGRRGDAIVTWVTTRGRALRMARRGP